MNIKDAKSISDSLFDFYRQKENNQSSDKTTIYTRNDWTSSKTKFDFICDSRLFMMNSKLDEDDICNLYLIIGMIVNNNYHMFTDVPSYLSSIFPGKSGSHKQWEHYMRRFMEEDFAQCIEEELAVPKKNITWTHESIINPSRKHQKNLKITDLSVKYLIKLFI